MKSFIFQGLSRTKSQSKKEKEGKERSHLLLRSSKLYNKTALKTLNQ
jgi:hypothetical protein